MADAAERGWVALNIGMFEGDRARKEAQFREALAIARGLGDTDLEFLSLAYLGASLVHADRREEGMVLLDLVPELAARVRAATREERFAGGAVPNFFRKPFGPGWALVGDAGYTKDPITAQGISDAFHDAELCATAVDETLGGGRSFEEAMSAYQQARDARALAIYDFTTQLATLEPPPPEVQQLLGAVEGNQAAMDGFVSVIAGTMSPMEFFDPANVQRLLVPRH